MLFRKFVGLVCLSSVAVIHSYAEVGVSDPEGQRAEKETKEVTVLQKSPLFQAMESALKKNKEILAAQKGLMATHEDHARVASSFKPNVSLNSKFISSGAKQRTSMKKNFNGTDNVSSHGIEVRHNLFNGFSDVATLKEADLSIKVQWYVYEAKQQEILKDVAILYFAIVAKRDEINHLKALLEARQNSQEVANWMYKTGAVKYLDVSQAIASVSETEAKLAKAAAEYVSYCAQFEEMTGYSLPKILPIPEKLFDDEITEKKAIEIAKNSNPNVIAAEFSLSAAKAAVKKPHVEFTPSVDVSYGFEQSRNHSTHTPNDTGNKHYKVGNTVSLNLRVPIYDGGIARADKRKYIALATQAAVNKEKAYDDVKTQISSTWAAMAAAKQSLMSAKKAVEARQLALHDAEEEYKSGVKIIKDVLDAQEQLFEARYMETQAQNAYFASQCRANALIGRMNAKNLKLNDSGFSYRAHFARTKTRI